MSNSGLSKNLNPTRPVIRTGRVLYSNPSLGYYAVLPDSTTSGMDGIRHSIDTGMYDFFGSGVSVCTPYSVGTPVIYTDKEATGEPIPNDFITVIGTGKYMPTTPNSDASCAWVMCTDTLSISGENDIANNAYIGVQSTDSIKDRSFGTPLDLSEGSYLIAGALKNYIHVGYGISVISGGYDNNLSFFTETNGCVFSTGGYYIHDTLLGREEVYADVAGHAVSIKQAAYSISESFGARGTASPFTQNESKDGTCISPAETGLFPVYRFHEFTGSIGQGYSISVSDYDRSTSSYNITNKNKDVLKAGILDLNEDARPDKTVHYGKSAIRTPWDGSVGISSLHSITLDKDYYIPQPIQIATESNTFTPDSKDTITPPKDVYYVSSKKILENVTQYASCLYEYSKLLSVRRLFPTIFNKIKTWKIFNFKEVSNVLKINEKKLPPLKATQQCYPSSPTAISDPISPGGGSLLEALSAFVHVAPSGAIVITDGHGAEIRLEGGNITLSPAGDLRILPGRDVLGIVPGKTSILSKDRVDIASDTSSVTIKGDTDISIFSTDGVISVESSGKYPLTSIGEDRWMGGGIIMKSRNGISMSGTNISIRRQSYDDTSAGREDTDPGSIVIDANNGTLLSYGKNIVSEAVDSNVSIGKASVIALSDSLQMVGKSTTLPGRVIIGDQSSSTISVPEITSSGLKSKQIRITSGGDSQSGLIVMSGAVFTKSLLSKSAIIHTLGSDSMRSHRGVIDSASELSGLKPDKDVKKLDLHTKELNEAANSASAYRSHLSNVVQRVSSDITAGWQSSEIYKASAISIVKLLYPSTEEYKAKEFSVVNSRWQRHLSSAKIWGSPHLVNDTMIFPGKEKWLSEDCVYAIKAKGFSKDYTYDDMFKEVDVSFDVESKGPLSQAYIINNGG